MNCFNIIWKCFSIIFRLHVLSLSSKVLRLKIQRLSDSPYVMVFYPDSISVLKLTWNCKLSKTVLSLRVERTVRWGICEQIFFGPSESRLRLPPGTEKARSHGPSLMVSPAKPCSDKKNLDSELTYKNCMLILCKKFIFYLDKNCNVGLFIKMSLNLTGKIGSDYRRIISNICVSDIVIYP